MKKILLYIIPLLGMLTTGCKKDYLETVPSNAISEQKIYEDIAKVYSALNGANKELFAYGTGSTATSHDIFGQRGYDLSSDLMGNDMVVHSQGYGWFNASYNYTEWLVPTQNRQSDLAWYFYFDIIKQTNILLTNIDAVITTPANKEIIRGQALGLRAYAYYYLINYFQQTYKGNEGKPGVPLYVGVSLDGKARGSVKELYEQIIKDLILAETLLTGKARAAKINMDLSVVQGFRARVALVMEEWTTAATYANKARQGYTLMTSANYAQRSAFSSISNPEWMWGSLISSSDATIYASFFSHIDISTGGYAALGGQKKITKELYDQINAGDIRKKVFRAPGSGVAANVDYNQLKFQVPTAGSWAGDYVYMRAAEMYLIEAEALSRQNNDAQARNVLERLIKTRFPAYDASGFSGSSLTNEILLQRRIELWGEGFALIDIKRLNQGLNRARGTGNHGAPSFDPGVYTTSPADPRFLMRIPRRELDNNSSLTASDQNP